MVIKKGKFRAWWGLVALLLLGGLLMGVSRRFALTRNLETLLSVFEAAMTLYVEEPDGEKLVERGIASMMSELDPYSEYIPEKAMSSLQFLATGGYVGVGALIRRADHYTLIAELYEGTPSARAGLRVGDTLKSIDGVSLYDMDIAQVSERLKGQPNTQVKLMVSRPYSEPKDTVFEVIRDNVHVSSVPYYGLLPEGVGYVFLSGFTQGCAKEIEEALNTLRAENGGKLKGIMLDLRNNSGGVIDEAQRLVSYFVPPGEVVFKVKGRDSAYYSEAHTQGSAPYADVPLVVLVNRLSASSSEIVAGALQDLDRALILGERTFGKGLVQSTNPLPYGGSLKITTARYYTPSGRCIQALDYTNRNEQGAVGKIPDSLVSAFTTQGGRMVYDGGGIYPDVLKVDSGFTLFLSTLYHNQAFFDYATYYRAKHAEIGTLDNFIVTQDIIADFEAFCRRKGLDQRSPVLDEYERVMHLLKGEDQTELLRPYMDSIKVAFQASFSSYFARYANRIAELLSEEIASRYYYARGRFGKSIRHDEVVDSALYYLHHRTELERLLREVSPADPRGESVKKATAKSRLAS